MLGETYKKNIKNIKEQYPNAVFVDVTSTSNSPLSPSMRLSSALRLGKITWDQFKLDFTEEIEMEVKKRKMLEIAKDAVDKDVFLLCCEASPKQCHRSILIEVIEQLAEKSGIAVKIIGR
jgi:uncharacterized protein YeaO (DUF488 family)